MSGPVKASWPYRALTVVSAILMLCAPRAGARLARWSRRMRARIGLGLARISRRITDCADQLEADDDTRGGR